LRSYELASPGPREVRVQVTFAAPKHGTEGHGLRGSAFSRKQWDPQLRLFRPRPDGDSAPTAKGESPVGNMVVGTVCAVGAEVSRFAVGERVFGYGPIREQHQAPEDQWYAAGDMAPETAVCVDPAHVALVAVRDGRIRLGDDVAVFGLGAIGLLAARLARAAGARRVFAIDPVALRRQAALDGGAEAAFDPTTEDAALAIKQATGGHGVDVAVETSGSGRALHEAIRCLRPCGTVVHVPWGPYDCRDLHLDEEFHLNRPTIIGSQAWSGWGCADRDHPLWDHQRAFEAAIWVLAAGRISAAGIVTPIVPFEEAAKALPGIFAAPGGSIKLGVRFAAA
jgi:threonine dehydrogenase-like Zn-dependent dehydrogenase